MKSKRQPSQSFIPLLALALLTAFASEIKVLPFSGELFRFGLGSIAFFLYILIKPPRSLIQAGIVTGAVVVLLRVFSEMAGSGTDFDMSIREHVPAFAFYAIYGTGLHLLKAGERKMAPLLLGAFTSLIVLSKWDAPCLRNLSNVPRGNL